MPPFSRIIPHALCCFYVPQHHDDSRHHSPIRAIPPTVPRQPVPYAMINVPHEPEMIEDVQAFRRMFTQSPACPHGSTPTQDKPKLMRLQPKGSLDMEYNFSSGSPVPLPKKSTSTQRLGNRVKQRLSEPRLSKGNSRSETHDSKEEEDNKQTLDPISDTDAILLGISAQSTGLSDLLRSRSGSAEVYDSDAKSIGTPILLSSAPTIKLSPEQAPKSLQEQGLRPDNSISAVRLSPRPVAVARNISLEQTARSSPFPVSPQKLTFGEALQLYPHESISAALKRLSAGIADGTINSATENELRDLRAPDSQDRDGTFVLSAQTPDKLLNSDNDPDTPQTVIKRLSQHVRHEKQVSPQTKRTGAKGQNLLDELDPALLDYLARFTPQHSSDSKRDVTPQPSASMDIGRLNRSSPRQKDDQDVPKINNSCEQSQVDLVSMSSNNPSESRSVHLFNMHISQRLASKSTATMLSPSESGNVSRKSLEVPLPLPGVAGVTAFTAQYATHVRTEHNRRPSDPHTRELFEQNAKILPPPRRHNTSLAMQEHRPRSRDQASSVYTSEGGPPSSAGSLSVLDSITKFTRNPNSMAIGGRSASSEIPARRWSRNQHSISGSSDLPPRSLSVSVVERPDQLEAASEMINRYIDGSYEDRNNEPQISKPPPLDSGRKKDKALRDSAISANTTSSTSKNLRVDVGPSRRVSAGWLTSGQRGGWNYNFVNEMAAPRARQGSGISIIAPETVTPPTRKLSATSKVGCQMHPSPLAESATDMWNRAYRDARKDNEGENLLSTPTFEMDNFRRSSSNNTIRLRHRSTASMHTPDTAIRRSHSAEPQTRQPLVGEDTNTSNHFHKDLKRLSLRLLRPRQIQATLRPSSRELQKRSSPDLAKKASGNSFSSDAQDAKTRLFGVSYTPPSKELLGIWGTFPSHDRAERNGSAGEADSVHARDFGLQEPLYEIRADPYAPLKTRSSTSALSAMNRTLRMLSMRSKRMDRTKTKSMSFPVTPGDDVQKNAKALFLHRWKRLYLTKSSELRGYMIAGGHRSSVSAGKPVEYPELETLPGEGMFASAAWRADSSFNMDGASPISMRTPDMVSYRGCSLLGPREETPMGPRVTRDCLNTQSNSKPSLWEPGIYRNIQEDGPRTSFTDSEELTSRRIDEPVMRSSSDGIHNTTPKHDPADRPATIARSSKDIKLPGSFGNDD